MKNTTLSILLTVLMVLTLFSCQKAIVDDPNLNQITDQISPLSTRTGNTLSAAGFQNLTAYISYNLNGLIFVTFNYGGTVPLSYAIITVKQSGQQVGGETISYITPGASISRTYGTNVALANGQLLTVTVDGSDGSSASASATVYIQNPTPPGTPPTGSAPGMASPPVFINREVMTSSVPFIYYTVTPTLTWNTNYLPMSSPYYNQMIYACMQYGYTNGAPYHYCVTNNNSGVISGYIHNGFLTFQSFLNFPQGGSSNPCSMPDVVAWYYQLTPFMVDTLRSERYTRLPYRSN
jgi:hypothetical protein